MILIEPKVSIIITNVFNTIYLIRCLESISNIDYTNYEVIVVDCLTQNIKEDLKEFSDVVIVHFDHDIGPAMQHNIGIEYSDKESKYVAFLDNDTIVDINWLKNAIDLMKIDSNIGIVGCKICDLENKKMIQCLRPICDIYGFTYNECVGMIDNGQFESSSERFAVSACSMICRKDLLEIVEGFDSKFFIFVDDIDICWRSQLIGFKVVENPKAIVYHKGGGTKDGGYLKESRITTTGKRIYYRERNTLRMLLKNYEVMTLVKILPIYFTISFAEVVVLIFIGRIDLIENYLQAVKWNIANIKDTCAERIKINKLRKMNDKILIKKLIHYSLKIRIFKDFGVPNIR